MEETKFSFSAAIPLIIGSVISLIAIANGGSFLWIAFVLIGLFITAIISGTQNAESQQNNNLKMKESLKKIPNFTPSKTINAFGNAYIFEVDEVNEKIALIDHKHNMKIIDFSHILGCEIKIDGDTISSKSTSRTIGGALVGGVILGGAGAVIGGLSGDSKQKKTVSTLTLLIKIKDISNPTIRYECYNATEATARTKNHVDINDVTFQNALNSANEVKNIITIILNRIDSNPNKPTEVSKSASSSTADELLKLHDLKEKGIITEDEFQCQKNKLLQ
jgi:hypothetical protein